MIERSIILHSIRKGNCDRPKTGITGDWEYHRTGLSVYDRLVVFVCGEVFNLYQDIAKRRIKKEKNQV